MTITLKNTYVVATDRYFIHVTITSKGGTTTFQKSSRIYEEVRDTVLEMIGKNTKIDAETFVINDNGNWKEVKNF